MFANQLIVGHESEQCAPDARCDGRSSPQTPNDGFTKTVWIKPIASREFKFTAEGKQEIMWRFHYETWGNDFVSLTDDED